MSHCSSLEHLWLSRNNLTGKLPQDIGYLSKLKSLSFNRNNLVGEIPSSFGNLSSLVQLKMCCNRLHGRIPQSFGQLKSLEQLTLDLNYHLSGIIPVSIYNNLSSIGTISVMGNQLTGSLPPDLGLTLPNLRNLAISGNQFDGSIPITISNASKLESFQISENMFTGIVPGLASLSNLWLLDLTNNSLGHRQGDDLDFILSLENNTNLEILMISFNSFEATLPESLGNFSTKLRILGVGNNWIHGSFPSDIGKLFNLEIIDAHGNQLTGHIPSSIGKLQKLYSLSLSKNYLSGVIPSSLGNMTLLSEFNAYSNSLEGRIPSSLGECKSLTTLDLSLNNLSGPIPQQLIGLSSLSHGLYLSMNRLTGPIPKEVGNLLNIQYLVLSDNELSGEIPETLGGCTSLMYLYLDGNSLQGDIPSSLVSLRGIEQIDFSLNNLSGKIPLYLETFHFLHLLNLSFNNFDGEVPARGVFRNATALSVVGNTRLCGGIPQLNLSSCSTNLYKKHQHSHKVMIIVVSVACGLAALIVTMLLLVFCVWKKRSKSANLGFPFDGISFLQVSYGDLFKATDGFSKANLIGSGSFGSVYKGILNQPETQVVAVKVLNLETSRASKSFIAECKALRRIKHRNLVRIITACSSIDFQGNDFKALIYEFMANGSLEEWLHPNHGENLEQGHRHLSLTERVNICLDVANALDYLHNQCDVSIVHCDLKPSNVLLDYDMNARLGDFGLVKFLPDSSLPFSSEQTGSLGIRGSVGYTAPEYGMGSEVSKFGDVYSYGILLLEMFTGKRPTDIMFRDGLNLHNFALMGVSNNVEEIVDATLLQPEDESSSNTNRNRNMASNQRIRECLISIIKFGIACSAELQRERMDIAIVVSELYHIKESLIGT